MDEIDTIDLQLSDFGGEANKAYKEYNTLFNPLELFMQELELAIKMEPSDVYNHPSSIDITNYVFNRYVTKAEIISNIVNYVIRNCEHSKYFNWDVDVDTILNNDKRILHIIFKIQKLGVEPSEVYMKKFQIEG